MVRLSRWMFFEAEVIRYTHPERLGANDYTCPKCGKNSHVRQFLHEPDITLMLQLIPYFGIRQAKP